MDMEVHLLQGQSPSGQLAGRMRCIQERLESLVVREQLARLAIDVWAKVSNSPHSSKSFQLCYPIVSLVGLQAPTGVSHWSHGPILLLLRQDSSEPRTRCIRLQTKFMAKSGEGQDRGLHEELLQLAERLLTRGIPHELHVLPG